MVGTMNSEVMNLINEGRALPTSEKEKRAECVLKISEIMDCKRFININRIVSGHARLNLSFVATIFNKYSNVNLTDEESMEYVRELIRRMKLKDKEHSLTLDQELEYVKKILSNNDYLTSKFIRLYSDRIYQIEWLNEYALDDTFEKPKEEAILKELSEIERRDKMIEELKAELEEKSKTIESMTKNIEEMTEKNSSANQQFSKEAEGLKGEINDRNTKIEEMTNTIKEKEEIIDAKDKNIKEKEDIIEAKDKNIKEKEDIIDAKDKKIKEMEELNAKQKESIIKFKKEVSEQLHLIETMMKKDMTQISKRDIDNGFESIDSIDNESLQSSEASKSAQSSQSEENGNSHNGGGSNSSNGDGSGGSNNNKDSNENNDINDEDIFSNSFLKDMNNTVDGSLKESYKKVESYVKRLLEELKKSKEQNYIYKSQIAQNDKINALLNEKIYQYSENACKEANAGVSLKNNKASSKGNLSKKKFVPS